MMSRITLSLKKEYETGASVRWMMTTTRQTNRDSLMFTNSRLTKGRSLPGSWGQPVCIHSGISHRVLWSPNVKFTATNRWNSSVLNISKWGHRDCFLRNHFSAAQQKWNVFLTYWWCTIALLGAPGFNLFFCRLYDCMTVWLATIC